MGRRVSGRYGDAAVNHVGLGSHQLGERCRIVADGAVAGVAHRLCRRDQPRCLHVRGRCRHRRMAVRRWAYWFGHAEVLVGGRRVVGNVRVFVGGRPHCVACIATAWLVSRLGHVCLWHHRVPARDLADTAAALQYLWWQVHREPVYKRFAHGAATSLVRHQLCRATRLFDVDDCPLCCARHRYHRHSTQRLWPNDRCDERQPSSVRHPRTQPHAPEARRVYGVICDSRFGWLDVGR